MVNDFTPSASTRIKLDENHNPPWYVAPHKFGWLIAEYVIEGTTFNIYGSRQKTMAYAEKKLDDRQTLIRTYQYLTGDMRLSLPFNACTKYMMYHVQQQWFLFNGFGVPDEVTSRMEESMAKAAKTEASADATEAPAATKEKRTTNRSIIESGLLAGTPDQEILDQVKAAFPEGKADMKHVAYYRHFLVKAGKLEAQPRRARTKKEAEVKEAAPAPVKATAAKAAPAGKPVATPTKAKR